jgi:hypothetical protein
MGFIIQSIAIKPCGGKGEEEGVEKEQELVF